MLTATFTELVPRGAHDATTPVVLEVDQDQLDDFAMQVIEHSDPTSRAATSTPSRSTWATTGAAAG